jgi:hypothetical protein
MGRRPEGWAHLERSRALEEEMKGVRGRVLTLCDMGYAALVDGDPQRAVGVLSDALPDARRGTDGTAALVLCRLARAHVALGRRDEAVACAEEALRRVETAEVVPAAQGPEIYATLADLAADGARREEFLARARAMTEARARHIGSDSRREYFLAQSRAGWTLPSDPGRGA